MTMRAQHITSNNHVFNIGKHQIDGSSAVQPCLAPNDLFLFLRIKDKLRDEEAVVALKNTFCRYQLGAGKNASIIGLSVCTSV